MQQLNLVRTDRLRQLSALLRTVPEEDFNLMCWIERNARPAKTALFGLITTRSACGFAGCAVGWAAHAGLFEGFRIYDDGESPRQPSYQGRTGWQAIALLFGLNDNLGSWFFSPGAYRKPEDLVSMIAFGPSARTHISTADVANRLDRFCDKIERWRERGLRREVAYAFDREMREKAWMQELLDRASEPLDA